MRGLGFFFFLFTTLSLFLGSNNFLIAKEMLPSSCNGRLINFLSLGTINTTPLYHTGNYRDIDLKEWSHSEKLELDESELRKGTLLRIYSDKRLPAFAFDSIQKGFWGGERAVFVSVLGDKYSFPIKRLPGGKVQLSNKAKKVKSDLSAERKSELLVLENNLRKETSASLRDEREVSHLATELTDKQMQSSLTASIRPEVTKQALFNANNNMLGLVVNGRALSIEDINQWNYLACQGNFEQEGYEIKGAGLLRGNAEPTDVPDPLNPSEITRVSMANTNVSGGASFWYTNANNVPAEMKSLLDEVNSVNRQSSLQSISSIYRKFIVIHPYLDGNGRTSRILFDYLLLKAGFPAAPNDSRTKRVLFKTEDDLYSE